MPRQICSGQYTNWSLLVLRHFGGISEAGFEKPGNRIYGLIAQIGITFILASAACWATHSREQAQVGANQPAAAVVPAKHSTIDQPVPASIPVTTPSNGQQSSPLVRKDITLETRDMVAILAALIALGALYSKANLHVCRAGLKTCSIFPNICTSRTIGMRGIRSTTRLMVNRPKNRSESLLHLRFSGLLVKNNLVDHRLFLEYWREGLALVETRLSAYLEQPMQGGLKTRVYYSHFAWLLTNAREERSNSRSI